MPIDPRNLIRVQSQPALVRNVCVLAHVDHGKTSLSDCLLATNGFVSRSEQGKLLYLDSREDEQQRGITMEASAISLFFKAAQRPIDGQPPKVDEYLVNLIDSPGHIDFSSEVTTTSRLCDGCVVVVDAVEGVCSQTIAALKQSWDEQLTPVLVVNKMDKLFSVLDMTAADAYLHIVKLVEQVNAVIGSFFVGRRAEEEYQASVDANAKLTTEEISDEELYFDPIRGNVVFGSAIDGWGFSLAQFAAIYERKLGVDRDKLKRFLWGDFYYDPKTKKVVKAAQAKEKRLKPMFVQFILDNIWAIYQAAEDYDIPKLEKVIGALQLNTTAAKEPKQTLINIFNAWIPISRAILMAIVHEIPSPLKAQTLRIARVLENTPQNAKISESVVTAMTDCDKNGPVVTFVSKVLQVPEKEIPAGLLASSIDNLRLKSGRISKETQDSDDSGDVIIGVARVFSGTIKVGDKLNILGPKYMPGDGEEGQEITINGLYMLMGRDLVPIQQAYPGTIIGIGGLDGKIVKSGTLVTPGTVGPNLAAGGHIAPPILRIALEPEDPRQLDELEHGLELLNISDPSVEFEITEDGEYILGTAGELHFERCLKDLQERFAKIEIETSEPVVPFQETIVEDGDWAPSEEDKFPDRGHVAMSVCEANLELLVQPLPTKLVEYLKTGHIEDNSLAEALEGTNIKAEDIVIIRGTSILIDDSLSLRCRTLNGLKNARGPYDDSIISGFLAAISKGPLIAEPVQGVAVSIKSVCQQQGDVVSAPTKRRIISATRKLIHEAMEQWSPRILLAMFMCEIQAPTEVLGKLYSVVTRRQGRMISEEIKDGTPFFNVKALVPVVESFGFAEEMRARTSGGANPQLVFDGFEVLNQDPYWVPTTQEELEDLGDFAERENAALTYVRNLRKRKGLFINEKLIESGEKNKSYRK